MKLLNIACGGRYHKDWINIDFQASSGAVEKVNLLCGLPFQNDSTDVAYSSHFFEHLSQKQAKLLLLEIKKVLKLNGILRIVVPDLENIFRKYLSVLDKISKNEMEHKKYEWITIELLDQLVRIDSGGEMGVMFNAVSDFENDELGGYILSRTGDELLNINTLMNTKKITLDKIKNGFIYLYLQAIRFLIPKNLRNIIFVNTSIGEKHQWMYDRYSMNNMMKEGDFTNISIQSYNESDIPCFNNYFLDIKQDDTPYKGISSLYIEGRK